MSYFLQEHKLKTLIENPSVLFGNIKPQMSITHWLCLFLIKKQTNILSMQWTIICHFERLHNCCILSDCHYINWLCHPMAFANVKEWGILHYQHTFLCLPISFWFLKEFPLQDQLDNVYTKSFQEARSFWLTCDLLMKLKLQRLHAQCTP